MFNWLTTPMTNPTTPRVVANTDTARAEITAAQRDSLVMLARQYDIPVKTIAAALGITQQGVHAIIRRINHPGSL